MGCGASSLSPTKFDGFLVQPTEIGPNAYLQYLNLLGYDETSSDADEHKVNRHHSQTCLVSGLDLSCFNARANEAAEQGVPEARSSNGAIARLRPRDLAKALALNTTLTTLYLNNNKLTMESSKELLEVLGQSSALEFLSLTGNPLGDLAIPILLCSSPTTSSSSDVPRSVVQPSNFARNCTSLGLGGCGLTNAGVESLVTSFLSANNQGLTSLNLANNSIDDEGLIRLAELVKSSPLLQTLSLSYNKGLGERGGRTLLDALKTHPSLSQVFLLGTRVSFEVLKEIRNITMTIAQKNGEVPGGDEPGGDEIEEGGGEANPDNEVVSSQYTEASNSDVASCGNSGS